MWSRMFFIVVIFYTFVLFLNSSYAQEVKYPSFAIEYTPVNKPNEIFSKGMGQCVDFVKESRPDWKGIRVGYARNMPKVAKERGFVVNPMPREGSILVVPHIGLYGHVAIVTKVEEKGDGYCRV